MRWQLQEGEPRTAEDMAATIDRFRNTAPPEEREKFVAFVRGLAEAIERSIEKETEK